MKKTTLVLLICTLLAIMGACAKGDVSAPQYDYEYAALEQLAENADIIVIGTIESAENADNSNCFYSIGELDIIDGRDVDGITVYGKAGTLKEGGRYALFLYDNDSVFWPMPLTQMVDIESVFEIEGDRIKAPEKFGIDNMDVAEFSEKASKLAMRQNAAEPVTDELPYDELAEASETIFIATVDDVIYASAYSGGTANLTPQEILKGTVDDGSINMLVPQGLQAGETYLFFRTDGIQSMPTRNNSVINVKSDEYAEIMKLLEK